MTESTQPADLSKSAQEVDTFAAQLADLKAALDRFPFLNEAAPAATYEVWERWRQVTMPAFIVQLVAAADRAKELEADARRLAFAYSGQKTDSNALVELELRFLNGDIPTLDEVRAAIDRAQGEQHVG